MKLNFTKTFLSMVTLGTLCIPVLAIADSFDCTIVETGEIFKVEELTGITRILWANGDKSFVKRKKVRIDEDGYGCSERSTTQKSYSSSDVNLSLESSFSRGLEQTRCAGTGYGKKAFGLLKKNGNESMEVTCDSYLGLGFSKLLY